MILPILILIIFLWIILFFIISLLKKEEKQKPIGEITVRYILRENNTLLGAMWYDLYIVYHNFQDNNFYLATIIDKRVDELNKLNKSDFILMGQRSNRYLLKREIEEFFNKKLDYRFDKQYKHTVYEYN